MSFHDNVKCCRI